LGLIFCPAQGAALHGGGVAISLILLRFLAPVGADEIYIAAYDHRHTG
jgi:hypothetical protein